MAPGTHDSRSDAGRRPAAHRSTLDAFIAGFWWPIRIAVALWLSDVVLLVLQPPGHPFQTVVGLLAGLFVAVIVSAVAGLGLGAVVFVSAARAVRRDRPPLFARALGWLTGGNADEQVLRSGLLIAAPPLLGVYALGSFLVTQRLIVGMARPEFVALAVLAEHLVLGVVVVILLAPVHSLATWLALGLGRIPAVGRFCFGRALHFALWLGWLSLVALALFVARYYDALSYLPWRELGQCAAALVVAVSFALLMSVLPRLAQRSLRVLGAVVLLVSAVAAFSLEPGQMFVRHIAEQALFSGRIGHDALMAVLDVDHDGYLPTLGGGDCAPFDPKINPGAIDIPGNHIDEDCDGADLDLRTLPRMGIFDLPVREDVPSRPPVILLTIDAFAATHMQTLGEKRQLTPNLDSFAAQSAFFRRCFAQGPSTRLSFPSIFTSRWDSQIKQRLIGGHPYPIEASEVMLAEVMRNAGYDTVAVLPDPYFSPSRWTGITSGFARVIETPFTTRPTLAHNGGRVTAAALAELKRSRTQPLFMWVHYYDAHSPHTQPEGIPVYGKTRRDLYDAELAFVDKEVGTLLKEIDTQLGGQALIIITGDHGIAFDAPRHEKFNYGYDLSTAVLHVPLIVHAPFVKPHQLSGIVSTMDIAPTLANLLRVRGPLPFEGVSLVPEILDNRRARPPELMHQMFLEERLWKNEEPLERVALRNDRFNLVQDRKSGFFELYEWQRDYFEKNDLSMDPAYETTLRDLRHELMRFTYVTRRPEPPAPVPVKPPAKLAKPPAAAVAPRAAPAAVPAPPKPAPPDEEP
jgi:arylsulfatase A-like enzyme